MKFKNIFILSAGRCGSMTIIRACEHITNYTSDHESGRLQKSHKKYNLIYPEYHIESDNRLTWFLGSLQKMYGNEAFYLKLTRNKKNIIDSYLMRKSFNQGIIPAYAINIFQQNKWKISKKGYKWAVEHYVNTSYNNIDYFLEDKQHKLEIDIDNPLDKFKLFWNNIQAKGNIQLALNEFSSNYNSSK